MISAPEEYGLTSPQTLAHTVTSEPPEGFAEYWRGFREAISTLPRRWHGQVNSSVNQVIIPSIGSVRIVGQVLMPEVPPHGVVVATHGYGGVPDDFISPNFYEPWLSRGLAVVRLRVRGFPPSTLDVPDLRACWILHGIESPAAWILRGAVGDLIQACRCARTHFGAQMPIVMHGESFGGGLAVLAAAQLTAVDDPPQRLILGLPTFGDWLWRSTHYCNGSGGQVNMLLDALRGDERAKLLSTLLLFDAAHHAPSVTVPCLCKLAQADDTVPAPAAAAVFNALASPVKQRFVTRFGHFDGGIADLRRHVLYERIHADFADPDQAVEAVLARHVASFEI